MKKLIFIIVISFCFQIVGNTKDFYSKDPKGFKTLSSNHGIKNFTEKGDKFLSFGIGIPGTALWISASNETAWFGHFSPKEFNEITNIPFYLKFDYMVGESYGLGLCINYSNYNYFGKVQTFNSTNVAFNVRLNKYIIMNEHLNVYIGIGIGLKVGDYTISGSGYETGSAFPLGFETTLGFKYISEMGLGFYAEAGWAKSIAQTGITMKIE